MVKYAQIVILYSDEILNTYNFEVAYCLEYPYIVMEFYHSQDITRATTIEDDQGHVLPAITVFALVIQYLKQDLHGYWLNQGIKVDDSEVRWVLTVPAIWSDKAKEFMREAAVQVCIIFINFYVRVLRKMKFRFGEAALPLSLLHRYIF